MPSLARLSRLLLLALCIARPVGAGEEPAPPYRVTLDLAEEIRELANEDPFERESAEELLGVLDERAIPALVMALERENAATRLGVVGVLESSEGSRATALLLERALGDDSVDVRAAAIAALISRMDPEAAAVVPGALASGDPRLYRVAFEGCARHCTAPKQLDRIVDFSFTEPVRLFGAGPRGALFRAAASPTRRPAVVAAVERRAAVHLEDPDPEKRIRAGLLFADLGDPRAVDALTVALETEAEPILRLQALVALGKIGDERGAERIADALPTLPPALRAGGCKALTIMSHRQVPRAEAMAREGDCPGAE